MLAIIISAVLAVLWYLAIDDIVSAYKYRNEHKETESYEE